MLLSLMGAAAVLSWFGWFALAPALGLPDISPAGVLNTALFAAAETGGGWVLVLLGLVLAAVTYFVVARKGLVPGGAFSGLLYGLVLWLLVGAVVMPSLAAISSPDVPAGMSSAPTMTPLQPSFMMAGRGLLAPLEALIGWLMFGALLGAAVRPDSDARHGRGWNKRVITGLAAAATLMLVAAAFAEPGESRSFEVWAIDQTGAGTLYIYPGASLIEGSANAEVIDLAEAAEGVGDGAGEKPHMIDFNPSRTHALIANAASGHVYVMRVSDRKIVASLDVGTMVHDVTPSPDGRLALVSKQEDKRVGVIETDYANEKFTYDRRNDLNLGRREGKRFPDNQPTCAIFPRDDRIAYVTLKGGGVYVVDATTNRPRIIEAFGADRVEASGCGAAGRDGKLYLGWGTDSLSRFYVFDTNNHTLLNAIPVDVHGVDAHGLTFAGGLRYLWQAVRLADSILIIDSEQERVIGTMGGFGLLPDMPVVSPTGEHIFLTLRGRAFFPLAADDPEHAKHEGKYVAPPGAIKRTTPGIVIFEVLEGGASGLRTGFVPMPPGPSGAPADPHAVAVLSGR